ncbi:MAG: hypothetical protein N2645_12910 [Clostridia bacterium]|nr:hypothetical protein [Clostridia bacterium]
MGERKISTLKIAATYIGTIVGAGFASGQEILQFFAVFGNNGIWGLAVVSLLFIVFGYIIMVLGLKLHSESHLKIIKYSGGRFIGSIIDFIITFFLFGALTAMIAGAGALVEQQFHIPRIWGNLFMGTITALTVLTGLNGVINSISAVVPFLIVSAIGISIASVLVSPGGADIMPVAANEASALIKNWFWAAILYTSYNIVLAISVLGPLGLTAGNRKTIRNGAVLGGLGLGVAALAIFFALEGNINEVRGIEVPMIFIASRISFVMQILYAVVLLAEIYTTAVGSLYGFSARITDIKKINTKYLVIGSTLLAFAASQLGFSNLVRYLYPVVGYGGIVLLAALLYSIYKLRTQENGLMDRS